MSLKDEWAANAYAFAAWARRPGHDSYPRFHRDQFLPLLPAPGRRTCDVGCGEGRLARDLAARGHRVVGIDASPTMVALARAADSSIPVCLGDAAALPLADGCADLVVHFMSLQDIDDLPARSPKPRACWSTAGDCASPSYIRSTRRGALSAKSRTARS
jgi:SAM-dependent methyltransferase